jgi:flagellar hook protein FlgE
MSLSAALSSAVSGLSAQSLALSTISANIANASTTGYKTEENTFDALVSASGQSAAGAGVSVVTNRAMEQQGDIASSSTTTNMAVNGAGFFVVSASANGPADADLYTRNGSFSPNDSGYLVNSDGNYLMGYATDASGKPLAPNVSDPAGLTAINVAGTEGAPKPTSTATMVANLPADLPVGGTVSSSIKAIDSEGVSQTINQTWTKTSANTWTMALAAPYATNSGNTTPTGTISPASVTVTFDGNGVLASTSPSPVSLTLGGLSSGASNSTFTLDLGTVGKSDGLTQYASSDGSANISITSNTQDGATPGSLSTVTISPTGVVTAKYDNGVDIPIAKVPIATFADQDALTQVSGSTFSQNEATGNVVLSTAGSGDAGSISASALESSTTDTGAEFDKMIVAQQAYSAAAQVVKSADSMFSTLIQAMT